MSDWWHHGTVPGEIRTPNTGEAKMVDDAMEAAAKVIDRLLCLMPNRDSNACENALLWLKRHDKGWWLSASTRDAMGIATRPRAVKP